MTSKIRVIPAALMLTSLLSIVAAWMHLSQQVLSIEALAVYSLIPLVLSLSVFIRNKIVLAFQFMLIIYAAMSYTIPLFTMGYYPWYLQTIPHYDGSVNSEVSWALMALADIAAAQVALIIAGRKETRFTLKLTAIDVQRALWAGVALVLIMAFFVNFLGTGKYIDGNIAANPISQLTQPQYVIGILMLHTLISKQQYDNATKYAINLTILLYILLTVTSGSRSGLVNLMLIYVAGWLLLSNELQVRHFVSIIVAAMLAVLLFVISTMFREGAGSELSGVFYHADDIYDGVAIYLTKRIGLHENLYQIANGYYNIQIYNEIGLLQFAKSTLDLLIPGTYFPGTYSLSALNQVWLYGYDLQRIATDWSSISVGLYAVNYLYFGKLIGWFVTSMSVYCYVIFVVHLIARHKSSWQIYFGIFLIFSFQPYFLTSFGYEYLTRYLLMAAANIYFWHWLVTFRSRSRAITR